MNGMYMIFAFHVSFAAPLLVERRRQIVENRRPKSFVTLALKGLPKSPLKKFHEAAFQITLQNSTEHAMFEHHRSARASSLRTNAKKDVHYFRSSAFVFKSNEIIKFMMPGST